MKGHRFKRILYKGLNETSLKYLRESMGIKNWLILSVKYKPLHEVSAWAVKAIANWKLLDYKKHYKSNKKFSYDVLEIILSINIDRPLEKNTDKKPLYKAQ